MNSISKKELLGKPAELIVFILRLQPFQKADLLVRWNFKHILNIERIHGYNAVNLKNGFQMLEIRKPREASDYEDNN
ncbi:hypothetical protein ACG2F4_16120 [Halalkalibaculum sp. DA3122]|uniref:hypothetical protein n=1 Tax=Halalkalibaculum sp. DA3122 TaxID=3373607 RepID=UPI0037542B5C